MSEEATADNGQEPRQDVFDRALQNAHPIFHGYIKAAKQYAEASKNFDEAAENWLRNR